MQFEHFLPLCEVKGIKKYGWGHFGMSGGDDHHQLFRWLNSSYFKYMYHIALFYLMSVHNVMVTCIRRWIWKVQLMKLLLPWICFSTTDLLNPKLFIRNGMKNVVFKCLCFLAVLSVWISDTVPHFASLEEMCRSFGRTICFKEWNVSIILNNKVLNFSC